MASGISARHESDQRRFSDCLSRLAGEDELTSCRRRAGSEPPDQRHEEDRYDEEPDEQQQSELPVTAEGIASRAIT
jgi:hypothetical protein